MDSAGLGKLVALFCLAALFAATVGLTPRIWHNNVRPLPPKDGEANGEGRGDPSP